MDNLCREQELVMERLERQGVQGDKGPKLNPVPFLRLHLGGHLTQKKAVPAGRLGDVQRARLRDGCSGDGYCINRRN
ncbi:hypothetical protein [Desulfonatronum thiodismutans]|uniref:hypothetical protein n=1 Tax=Desulfonatronum thiodismutans TaxID=159290 RepID=UPI0012684C72|nr:hypothetical protein [Desulfonatronum thiodismutans]